MRKQIRPHPIHADPASSTAVGSKNPRGGFRRAGLLLGSAGIPLFLLLSLLLLVSGAVDAAPFSKRITLIPDDRDYENLEEPSRTVDVTVELPKDIDAALLNIVVLGAVEKYETNVQSILAEYFGKINGKISAAATDADRKKLVDELNTSYKNLTQAIQAGVQKEVDDAWKSFCERRGLKRKDRLITAVKAVAKTVKIAVKIVKITVTAGADVASAWGIANEVWSFGNLMLEVFIKETKPENSFPYLVEKMNAAIENLKAVAEAKGGKLGDAEVLRAWSAANDAQQAYETRIQYLLDNMRGIFKKLVKALDKQAESNGATEGEVNPVFAKLVTTAATCIDNIEKLYPKFAQALELASDAKGVIKGYSQEAKTVSDKIKQLFKIYVDPQKGAKALAESLLDEIFPIAGEIKTSAENLKESIELSKQLRN